MEPTKLCHRCSQRLPRSAFSRNRTKRDGLQSYCKACKVTYPSTWHLSPERKQRAAARAKRWAHQHPEERGILRRASGRVRYAVGHGKLTMPTACEECGTTTRRLSAAHADYSQPLVVRWLCSTCHVKWDRAQPKLMTTPNQPAD